MKFLKKYTKILSIFSYFLSKFSAFGRKFFLSEGGHLARFLYFPKFPLFRGGGHLAEGSI